MKITKKKIIIVIILLVIGYVGEFFFDHYHNGYHFERNFKRYSWLFNESAINKVDTFIFGGRTRGKDAQYTYNYEKNTHITIWEYTDLSSADFKNIIITQKTDWPNEIKFNRYEIFNKTHPYPLITTKLGFKFKNPKMYVNIDKATDLDKIIDTTNYKAYFGKINKMSFNNDEANPLIFFDYKQPKQTLLIFYKGRQSFFVIFVTSNEELDKNIINIFNLK